MRERIKENRYARNVITLMTGTGLAQAVPIAISPVLTRLYTPEDFGVFALIMAIASIASVIVTGRYELAIMLPRRDRDAFHIAAISFLLAFIVSVVLLLIALLFNHQIAGLLGSPEVAQWLYWAPASTLLTGAFTSLSYWNNRKADYRRLASVRVLQSAGSALPQLGAGFLKSGPVGLVGGQIAGQLCSTVALLCLMCRDDRNQIVNLRLTRILALSRMHIDFPKYMIVGQLMNTVSGYLPLFFLSMFFGPAIAGFYSLSQRVVLAPSSLIGSAIGEVYRTEASRQYRTTGTCEEIYRRTFYKLVFIALAFVLPILLFGKEAFSFVFGEAWEEAGEIASVLAFLVFFQTISSPLSETVLFANKQKLDLIWQAARLVIAACALWLGSWLFEDYTMALIAFAGAFSCLYIVHSFFQYSVARGGK